MLHTIIPLYLSFYAWLFTTGPQHVDTPARQPAASKSLPTRVAGWSHGPSAPVDATYATSPKDLLQWLPAPSDTDSTARARQLRYKWKDSRYDASRRGGTESPLFLPSPDNVETIYELAPDGSGFYVYEQVGGHNIRPPSFITYEEYRLRQRLEQRRSYFRQRYTESAINPKDGRGAPGLNINSRLFQDVFGSGRISIDPNVTVLLDLSRRTNRLRNPSLSIRQQKNTFFDFKQQIQLNVNGSIGEKLKIRVNYDTEATFNFENQFKVEYVGLEDDVIKSVEAGNVSLPLNGSLINGGQNLWGIKLGMQFGPVTVTTVASQQRGKTNEIVIRGGSSQLYGTKSAAEYDVYRHFFLNHYFRSIYEQTLNNLPLVLSPINVTRLEVYITNRSAASTSNTRNGVGLIDLAENDPLRGGVIFNPVLVSPTGGSADDYPNNGANNLYSLADGTSGVRERATAVTSLQGQGLRDGDDFVYLNNLRRLMESEYTFDPKLGYISLNSPLQQNDVLFVAYEYTVAGQAGVFKVGEFSNDLPADPANTNVLLLKMIKPDAQRPGTSADPYPTWDLMMKNIYAIGGFDIKQEDFRLEVVYESVDGSGDINYLPASNLAEKPLLQTFELDQLTNNMEAGADGAFDFLPSVTILPDRGQIMFPVLEPFGAHLDTLLAADTDIVRRDSARAAYVFQELYDETQTIAIQNSPEKNRFKFRGNFGSSNGLNTGTSISLNAVQVVPGSVRVTSGSRALTEGVDYTVDYNIGMVTLLNPALLNSGQDIRINFESNQLFGIDQKTLLGARIDYKVNNKLQLGGTFLYLNERPLINKVVIGEEPMSNVQWGLDVNWNTESRGITNFLNKWPWYQSQAPSRISFQGEFAQLLPGAPKQIRTSTENGIAYLDDFEGAQTGIELGNSVQAWKLASYPAALPALPADGTSLEKGYTRAALAWYQIDPRFYDQPQTFGLNNLSPSLNDPATRRVTIPEVFPNRTIAGTDLLSTFDLYYRPAERGAYNYATAPAYINPDGTMATPEDSWGGIMRRTTGATDFQAANFEFIEFWLLDPYILDPAATGGKLYFNLGRISEDVLPDGQFAYENGLPTNAADNANNTNLVLTPWGRVPAIQVTTNAFDNDPGARDFQDAGLDGLISVDEAAYFGPFVTAAQGAISNPEALSELTSDPSTDDFVFFYNYPSGTDILTRYRKYNGLEGNSPINLTGDFSEAATLEPDVEDINQDGTFRSEEAYWEYSIPISPDSLAVGNGYVIDKREVSVSLRNGTSRTETWYQFRVPIQTSGTAVGSITDFTAIDFIRMYLTEFDNPVVLRFGSLKLVSTIWRRFEDGITSTPGVPASPLSTIELGTLNIEENSGKLPFNYVIPPDIQRQGVPGSPIPNQLLNEQSLVLRAKNMQEGEGQAAFRTYALDLRFYKRLKLWLHAEGLDGLGSGFVQKGDAEALIRIGSDYTNNYYELRIPLTPSEAGNQDPLNIWREDNQIDLELQRLNLVKEQRNAAGASLTTPFEVAQPDGSTIAVIGTPQLNNVRSVMIGVYNPVDGGGPISMELWANELRVTDFDNFSGWAATGRLNITLADLGSVSLSGSHSTPGYGSVEKRISERQLETDTRYDIALNLNIGKLFPEKWKLDIPFYGTYGERRILPKYTPTDPDVLLDTRLEAAITGTRDDALNRAIDYERNYSYAFTNVRKLRGGEAKVDIWDVENFAFTYSFSERFRRNAQIEREIDQKYLAGISWNYNFSPKNYEPFKRKKAKVDSTGQAIPPKVNAFTNFNFYIFPQNFTATIDGNRSYYEQQLRQQNPNNLPVQPTFVQDFTITRTGNLRWDFSKSLGMSFTTTVRSRVDEPRGPLDGAKRDTLWRRVFHIGRDTADGYFNTINLGRALNYQHTLAATYQVPFQQFQVADWLNGTVGYNANFVWQTAALQNTSIGNTIQNGRTWNLTGQASLEQLYNKIPWLEQQLRPIPRRSIFSEADSTRTEGDEAEVAARRFWKGIVGTIFGLKQVDVTYTRTQATILPGFLPRASNFGLDYRFDNPDGPTAGPPPPGWDFVFGYQPDLIKGSWLSQAGSRGWISKDSTLLQPFSQTDNTTLQIRGLFKPLRGLEIQLEFARNESFNNSGLYAFSTTEDDFLLSNRQGTSTFSISTISVFTAFDPIQENSPVFNELSANRLIISERLRLQNPDYDQLANAGLLPSGYWNGYTGSSQEVLIPAFLSAYGVHTPSNVPLSGRPSFPLPNWNISYTGLSDSRLLRNIFQSITITHGYKSLYTENSLLNLNALDLTGDGIPDTFLPIADDTTGTAFNLQPKDVVQQVMLTETFSPLIGINLVWKSGLSLLVDFKRSRTIILNIGALQLSETQNTEITTALSLRRQGSLRVLGLFSNVPNQERSVTYRIEGSLRNTRNQNRRIDADLPSEPTGGNLSYTLKPSIDYNVSSQLTARLYYEYTNNRPVLSNSFPNSFSAFGIQIRFTIGQQRRGGQNTAGFTQPGTRPPGPPLQRQF